MSTTTTEAPRIYVACLAAYNGGRLHGTWIDCDQDADSIHEEIQEMLKASPEPDAEEWAIHDHEGFKGISISESESMENVAKLAELLEEHGPAYAAYVNHVGEHYATPEGFEDAYQGEWDSKEDFTEELFTECHEIPENLECYIDWEKMARDWFINDFASEEITGRRVYVFRR